MDGKKYLLLIFVSLHIISYQCTDNKDKEDIEKIQSPQVHITEPKYYTPEDEGRWISKSNTHTPIITFSDKEKNTIEVRVPLQPGKKPRHYIEVIALMQGKKQIDVKNFKFSLSEARAKFILPDPNRNDYCIIAKCNLHDMWKAPVQKK